MKRTRLEFFAFSVNEYFYKRIPFSRHFKLEAAQKAAYRPYKGTAQSDFSSEILKGREALEAWAKECDYEIDWEKQVLIYIE